MTLLQSHSTAPAAPLDKHYPIQKVEHFADLPEHIQAQWRYLPHYSAFTSEPDADCEIWADGTRWSLLTSEGSNREEFRLTGIAVIDADRYVARVQVNGGRTAFYPVIKGIHYCCDRDQWGTKTTAFQYLADHMPTEPTDSYDIGLAIDTAHWGMSAEFGTDETDRAILTEIVTEHDKQLGARVGDFIRYPDGRLSRFTHDHDERGLQVGMHPGHDGEGHNGRFHLSRYGADYSGSLDRCVKREHLSETGERRLGTAWFWHHGRAAASNGVDVRVPFRVFACAVPAAGVGA